MLHILALFSFPFALFSYIFVSLMGSICLIAGICLFLALKSRHWTFGRKGVLKCIKGHNWATSAVWCGSQPHSTRTSSQTWDIRKTEQGPECGWVRVGQPHSTRTPTVIWGPDAVRRLSASQFNRTPPTLWYQTKDLTPVEMIKCGWVRVTSTALLPRSESQNWRNEGSAGEYGSKSTALHPQYVESWPNLSQNVTYFWDHYI